MNCEKCGAIIPDGDEICLNCGYTAGQKKVHRNESVLAGTVGAFIGALIGGGCIILLSQLGYIASVSGVVLAVCTLKGYELLGKNLSKLGVLICLALMLVTPYLADRLDWAIVLMQEFPEYNMTIGEAFRYVPILVEEEAIELGEYLKNLLMIYGFTLLGAISSIINAFKKK